MNLTVVYLEGYKPDEEVALRSSGTATMRYKLEDILAGQISKPSSGAVPVLFRGPRVSPEIYGALYESAQVGGLAPMTSPQSFHIADDFRLHYPLLRNWSPAALVVEASVGPEELAKRLETDVLTFPVFVRSDLESAAKYVGLKGCVLSSPSLGEVRSVLDNLRQHVKGFRSIILKEMRPIKKLNGVSIEYRAIGLHGRLLHFDFAKGISSLPEPNALGLGEFADKCFHALRQGGADGATLLDVGILEDESPIVVECKDFLNGSIARPEKLSEALAQHT